MKNIVILYSAFFLILFLASTAQATISISDPNDVYNLGDNLEVETEFSCTEQVQGFLKIVLLCGAEEKLIYFSPKTLETSTNKVDVSFPINDPLGTCYVSVYMEDDKNNKLEEETTESFSITDKIDIDASLNKYEFEPSEDLKIEGTAIKENGENIDGIFIVSFDDIKYSDSVSNGKFSYTTELAEDILPGPHTINLKIEDEKGNRGNKSIEFKIKQIPTSLTVETNKIEFLPDEILVIKPKLFDQANQVISDNVIVKLISKESILFIDRETIMLEESVLSGGEMIYRFLPEAVPGEYFIEISFADLKNEKIVSVLELEKIDIMLENDNLMITNTGNVPYVNSITINFIIEDQIITETINLDLEVGETKTFKLEAPKGTYDLNIKAGNESKEFLGVPLTGNMVATVDLDSKKGLTINWLWIFLLIMGFLLLLLYFVRNRKNHQIKKKPEKMRIREIEREHKMLKSGGNIDKDIKDIFNKNSSKLAAQTIMPALIYGTKQEISVLLMSISGLEKFKDLKKNNLDKFNILLDKYFDAITKKIKIHQGVADLYGNNLVIFFNAVKQYRHDIAAIKTAQDIREITNAFNEATKNFGIKLSVKAGINSGLAIVSSIGTDRAVKYTSIGNTISLAKALKNKAIEGEILIPEKIYEKVSNVINTKKMMPFYLTDKKAINVYAIRDSKDIKTRHKWYVDRALRK